MKQRLPLLAATLFIAAAVWAVSAAACDNQNQSAAASAKATCSHATAAQAAACKAKSASAASVAGCCAAKSADLKTAAAGCSHDNGAATTAEFHPAAGCPHAHGASAASAHGACPYSGSAAGAGCQGKDAAAADAGWSCGGRGFAAGVEAAMHGPCDACADMARCDEELRSLGSVSQVVSIKNGVMFIHTASNPGTVRAVQAAITRRNERLNAITLAGDKAHLCPGCREMRGAIASGKLTREVVTIEGGCLTLMTSGDPAMVAKLHAMAETPSTPSQTAARIKS
jgi:hypothetical protein